jgi:3-hydroxyisobutyrate dehydrogenase
MNVAVVGLGRMGGAMVQRLVAQGFTVRAWDRSAQRVEHAVAAGAQGAGSARDVAQGCEVILCLVNDDVGAWSLYTGEAGLLDGGVRGKLVLEMSTLQPQTVRRLDERVRAAGGALVGAPLMGTVPSVLNGDLFIPLGGEAADVERAQPVLQAIAREVRHVGPVGAGHAAKLASNLSMAAYLQSLAEGLALGMGEGVSLQDMLGVLQQAPTACGFLKGKMPAFLGQRVETTLDLANLRKDMLNAVAAGAAQGVPMAMTAAVATVLSAAVAGGAGGEDLAVLPAHFREHLLQRPA